MTKRFFIVFVLVFSFIFAPPAFAAPPSVDLPSECTVVDTDGVPHTYSGEYLGICALEAARLEGIVSTYTLQNFSFGLFLQSLNGVVPGETEFWALSHNNVEASVGLADLVVAEEDIVTFQLTDWSTNTKIGSPIEFSVRSLLASVSETSPPSGGGGAGEFLEERLFSVEYAFDFLVAQQHTDGSFGSLVLTDWAAIAFGVETEECNEACPAAREKLRAYVANTPVSSSSATELERHIMALEALDINPYESPGSPIEALVAMFDGVQIGDPSLVNDDIFATFPLLHAGYSDADPMMNALVAFILSKQKTNGSWEDSIDLTAAAIQALEPFSKDAIIERAKEFLHRNQNESGIFGVNSFSLSWVLQAIGALGETSEAWKKSGVTPSGYLGIFQQEDGGMEPKVSDSDTRVWATAYAIPAAFRRPWNDILQSFGKPVPAITTSEMTPSNASPPGSGPVIGTKENISEASGTSAEQNPLERSSDTTEEAESLADSQLALAGAAGSDVGGFETYLILALILLFSALFAALAYPFLSRFFSRLFR